MMLIRTSSAIDPTSMVKDRMGALSELMPSNLGLGGTRRGARDRARAAPEPRRCSGQSSTRCGLEVIPRIAEPRSAQPIVDSVRADRSVQARSRCRWSPERIAFRRATVWAKRGGEIKLLDREDAIDDIVERTRRSEKRAAVP